MILSGYALVHLAKLEVFPLYMFAMYSLPEEPKTEYATYALAHQDERLVLTDLDYRAYTYLTNTLQQYDGIVNNSNTHQECRVLDKFLDRLRLEGSWLANSMRQPCTYDRSQLNQSLEQWIGEYLDIENPNITIIKELYKYEDATPILTNTIRYELGQ